MEDLKTRICQAHKRKFNENPDDSDFKVASLLSNSYVQPQKRGEYLLCRMFLDKVKQIYKTQFPEATSLDLEVVKFNFVQFFNYSECEITVQRQTLLQIRRLVKKWRLKIPSKYTTTTLVEVDIRIKDFENIVEVLEVKLLEIKHLLTKSAEQFFEFRDLKNQVSVAVQNAENIGKVLAVILEQYKILSAEPVVFIV